MKVDELKDYLPDEFIEVLRSSGIEKLNPMQELCVKQGLLSFKNLLVSSPTASGKTLVAVLAAANALFNNKGRVVYLSPLRALAVEKYEEFKELLGKWFKVGISTGDYDSSDEWLSSYDIVVLTYEKAESLYRHSSPALENVAVLVADEIHLVGDNERGATVEIILTKLKEQVKQVIALSATVKNAREIALWLNASVVESSYRPVKLREGVLYSGKIFFSDGEVVELSSSYPSEVALVEDTLKLGKQILIFTSTRKSAETLASNLKGVVSQFLSEENKRVLADASQEVLSALETPTEQCRRLAECVRHGVAFHHAGLVGKQRTLVEKLFKEGALKVICATPTLAAGVNLPAFRVLIRDVRRYAYPHGMSYIPVLEYQQMAGRAGRPRYDKEGQAIILARKESEIEKFMNMYVHGECEEIYSRLAVYPVLRMHVLGLIASGYSSLSSISSFISKTLYAYQYGNTSYIEDILEDILEDLCRFGMTVVSDEKIVATGIGKRTSELYLDPESAYKMLKARYESDISLLYTLCSLREMMPHPYVKEREEAELYAVAEKHGFDGSDIDISAFKLALVFYEWINEADEKYLSEKYGVTPGELYGRIEIMDWLLYSVAELWKIVGKDVKSVEVLRERVKYGVRKELLPLVRIRFIGRKRARKLWNWGIRSVEDLRKCSLTQLSSIIGEKTAKKVKEELLVG